MQSGEVIAERYRLEEKIGEGGMAAVFRAVDQRLDRPVAIKFLFMRGLDDAAHAEAVEGFRREAKIAAAVHHRNVVQVLDFGTHVDGTPFMAMEFLDGASLGAMLDGGHAFSVRDIIKIIGLSLQGLIAVHAAGIVHRDIKPENIFLLRDRDGFYPKLLDFGISKSVDASQGRASAIKTKDGLFVGTPMYMSSEQARGIPDIDERTDVYSLGVILYELLAGHPPYDTEHVGDLLMRIMGGGAPPLSEVSPQIGQALSDVVSRAMHVDRDARYQRAEALYDALMSAAVSVEASAGSLSMPPPGLSAGRGGQQTVDPQAAPTAAARGAMETLDLLPAGVVAPQVGAAAQAVATDMAVAASTAPAGGGGGRGWMVAGVALLLGGAGLGYGLFAARSPAAPAASRYIVVETPQGAGAAQAVAAAARPVPVDEAGAEAVQVADNAAPAAVAEQVDDATERPAEADARDGHARKPEGDGAKPKSKRPVEPGPAKAEGDATTAAGRLSQAFAAQQDKLSPCLGYADTATGLPQLSMRFRIDERGRVLSTRLSPASLRETKLGKCLEARAKRIRFERQRAPIAFSIPLHARAGG